jgi:hypothetical protein
MANIVNIPTKKKAFSDLILMNGSSEAERYAIVARCGDVFLGIKFSGLADGALFGLPDKTYVNVLLRSARNESLAAELDLKKPADNVVLLVQPQLALDAAWPELMFERVNAERASLVIGSFIQGVLGKDTPAILTQVRKGDLLRDMVAYAVAAAGPENCITDQDKVAGWLANQAEPLLLKHRKKFVLEKAAVLAKEEFGETMIDQGEVIAAHAQNFKAIFQRHVNEQLMSQQLREMYDKYPPPV